MNLDDFLQSKGTDLSSLMTSVETTIGFSAGDVLLAVGSLVEGLGNHKSDIDLVLIKSQTARCEPCEVAVVVGKCLADVQILESVELENLLSRFDAWARQPWELARAAKFTPEERRLLHRLLHSYPLWQGARSPIAVRPPALADLCRLKLHVARQMARTIQVDMVGLRDSCDHRSLVFASQDLLGHAIDALTASHRLTNPTAKWRSKLLDSLPADWERSLTVRPTGLSAHELVWRLHRAPERASAEPAAEHAFRIASFARAVFAHAERRLVGQAETPTHRLWLQVARKRRVPLPCLDLDVDFFAADGKVTIGRLNEFGQTLELSPQEFEVTLLFDGMTTAGEANSAIYGASDEAEPVAIHRLVERIARANLSVPVDLRDRVPMSRGPRGAGG